MVFKCQEDSFLTEFSSKVVKCEPTKEPIIEYGKTIKFEGYQVTLENTILFPAGGGQPHDIGWLNDKEVLQVLRKGDEALHFTKEPIDVGTIVEQKINWERRFDHMQQHSGQHLLSAILEKEHNLPTTSWWLGAEESYVELDSTNVPEDVIAKTEDRCNQLIRQAVPVDVKFCRIDDPSLDEPFCGRVALSLSNAYARIANRPHPAPLSFHRGYCQREVMSHATPKLTAFVVISVICLFEDCVNF
ncbi:alanyl-tRNA editing protein Aarsd1 [Phthorimaea operculella]|nr:alanyl-tRNA editing protein Aarsd1 [Phthorimaea operculella]